MKLFIFWRGLELVAFDSVRNIHPHRLVLILSLKVFNGFLLSQTLEKRRGRYPCEAEKSLSSYFLNVSSFNHFVTCFGFKTINNSNCKFSGCINLHQILLLLRSSMSISLLCFSSPYSLNSLPNSNVMSLAFLAGSIPFCEKFFIFWVAYSRQGE